MVGRNGTPIWIECECGQRHLVLEAEVGELESQAAPRRWRVASSVLRGWIDVAADRPAKAVDVACGTLLRYDQRDYDSSWRHEGWDRFRVLDGPLAGTCVTVTVPTPSSPVSADLAPLDDEVAASR